MPIGRDRPSVNEIDIATFRKAIRATHGADAQLVHRQPVVERFEGEVVWEGEVLVFQLLDHPQAKRCYAWEVDGRVTAVLGVGKINSPLMAVRASIMAMEEPTAG
jgi:hypothetical protein